MQQLVEAVARAAWEGWRDARPAPAAAPETGSEKALEAPKLPLARPAA